jgi:hypothetical protein
MLQWENTAMKYMNKFVLALSLVLFFSAQGIAAPKTGHPAQIAKRKAARAAITATQAPQRAQLIALTGQLQAERKKKPVDQNRIDDLTRQITVQRETMRVEQLQLTLDRSANLKPAQKKREQARLQKMKDRLAKSKLAK